MKHSTLSPNLARARAALRIAAAAFAVASVAVPFAAGPALAHGEAPANDALPAGADCVGYDPANLTIVRANGEYEVHDGNHSMLGFVSEADARAAVGVAARFHQLCFVGREAANSGPDRYRHIMTYFQ
jgi:hypothetical protein